MICIGKTYKIPRGKDEPSKEVVSILCLHFEQIAVQRVALEIKNSIPAST